MIKYMSAPWREEYVKKAYKNKDCILCHAYKIKNDQKAYILYRGEYNFILLNKFPYGPGHLMIAPYEHIDSFENTSKESTDEFIEFLKMSLRILKKNYSPHGFNIGMNIGQSAGAGIVDHYHIHVIPRWVGDSNFMPLISKTKIAIESLETTYGHLSPLFQKKNNPRVRQKK